DLFSFGGLRAETPIEFLRSFVSGWVWPREWPMGAFYDSRNMGGGWVLLVALALSPLFLRAASRREVLLVTVCIVLSLVARDFWLPRYAYTLVIAITIVVGRAMAAAAASASVAVRSVYAIASVVLVAHLARPEFDLFMLRHADIGPRINPTASPIFVQ